MDQPRQRLIDQDHGVLLQVVPLAGDVADDFHLVRQADLGDLAESRVRLLRRRRVHAGANATLLGAPLKMGGGAAVFNLRATLADQLVDRRHY